MYEAACSSPLPAPARQQQQQQPLESEEISLFLQHLLHSSSSSTSSSSSSARQKQMSFSASGLYSSSSSSAQFGNLPMMENNQHRLLQSVRVSESEFRVRDGASTSTDDESSAGLIVSGSGVYCPPQGMKEAAGIMSSVGVRDCDAVAVSIRGRKQQHQAVENDLDEFDCDSEEGVEASEEPPKPASTRSSSKRSRAAEVHNLSEKRRRSRINEKMKALQNLIPNSNKTDKASMLDEAIEYLKQLQLQVQMLSMRNGLSLHPMYLPGVLQPPQLPQVRMGFSKGNGLPPHMNAESGTRPMNQECSLQTSFGPSNQCTTSRQPMVISSMANNSHSETSYGLDSPDRVHQGPFPLSSAAEDIFKEDVLSQQQLHVNQSARNPLENKMKPMAASSVTFDARGSILENSNSVEECLLRADRSPDMFPKDLDDNQIFVQHLHSSHSGVHVNHDNSKISTMNF